MERILQHFTGEKAGVPFGARLFAVNTLAMLVLGAAGGHKHSWSPQQTNR